MHILRLYICMYLFTQENFSFLWGMLDADYNELTVLVRVFETK